MQSPPTITFRNLESSSAVEDHIRRRIEELEDHHPRIVACDVVVSQVTTRQVTGNQFEVDVTVRIPGPDVRVSSKMGRSTAADDVNLAIHRAFDAARRELKERQRKMDHLDVKHHPPVLHGVIDRLFEGEGYGFIQADDGNEVYFEQDNLTSGNWRELRIGMKVRFREADGPKGSYATNVAVRS